MAKRGETKEKIITSATKLFMTNGYEATSVKMIIEEAGIVTGSFYHFFGSKESLFEAVIESFLGKYTERIESILKQEHKTVDELADAFFTELQSTSKIYYDVLGGDKLHWTIQYALHGKTLEAMVQPLAEYLTKAESNGLLDKKMNVDNITLSKILINGSEAIIHSDNSIEVKANRPGLKKELLEFWKTLLYLSTSI